MKEKSHFIGNLIVASLAAIVIALYLTIPFIDKPHPTIEIKSAFPLSLVTNTEPKISLISILVTPPFLTITNKPWIYFDIEGKDTVCIFNFNDKEWNMLTNKYHKKLTTNEISFFNL